MTCDCALSTTVFAVDAAEVMACLMMMFVDGDVM
jgi:hypothetical protein